MTKIKKSIVFCHGIWADGSCFNKVIPALQDEGFEVMSAQYGLDTNEGVAYLLGADNPISPLLSRLRGAQQPVVRPRHACAAPCSHLLARF